MLTYNRRGERNMNKEIKLNNGEDVVKKIEDEKGEYEFTFARIISGNFLDPIITDENIINNSKFITELFDSATIEEQPKKKQKTIKYNLHK